MSKPMIEAVTKLVLVAELIADLEQLARHSQESVKHRAADMAVNGLLQPIGVLDGKPMRILYGHGRYLSAKVLGWKEIEAKVFPAALSETQSKVIGAGENFQRTDLTGYEKYRLCVELLALNPEWKAKDLADQLHLDPGMITRLLSASRCIPAIQDALKGGLCSIEDCYTASRLSEAEQHEYLAARRNGASAADLARRVRRSKNGNGQEVRLAKVKILLAVGATVALSGKELHMESVVELLAETLKEARKAHDAGYDVRTWQAMMRDKARG
jgi:ParB/RepB/Spo0J family partition protein